MGEFTLDASGFVRKVGHRNSRPQDLLAWADLGAFTQGYVEGVKQWRRLLAYRIPPQERVEGEGDLDFHDWTFSDLAPEALAMILRDCAAAQHPAPGVGRYTVEAGRRFWAARQAGQWKAFPPLAVYLGDDGKVRLRAAA